MTEQEQWRPVLGYEGIYSISSLGRVRRDAGGSGSCRAGRILKPGHASAGRLEVTLCRDGSRQTLKVHRLVMLAFVGPCPEGKEVAHANGDPTDNRLANLRYDTRSENHLDCHRYGGRISNQKLTLAQVAEIRMRLAAGEPQRSIAHRFGVDKSTIARINTGKTWAHRLDQSIIPSSPSAPP